MCFRGDTVGTAYCLPPGGRSIIRPPSTVVLQKPLGTDVYNIEVFNSNSTEIEKYLNQALTNIQSINEQLAGGITSSAIPYFNHLGKQLNIDITGIEFGIYILLSLTYYKVHYL